MHRLYLPRPAAPAPTAAAFALYPLVLVPLAAAAPTPWVEMLYRWALEQARETARPALPERDLLGVWN
jgi:hypothetical protein